MKMASLDMSNTVFGLPSTWTMKTWMAFKRTRLDFGFNRTEIEVNLGRELSVIDRYGINKIMKSLERSVLGDDKNADIRRA
jgi:hypothetical protein